MEPEKPYPAVIDHPTYTLLLENDQELGWVDYRQPAISMDGNDCLTRRDDRDLITYPALCFISPFEEIEAYFDPELKELGFTLKPDYDYVLLLQYQDVFFTAFGHSGPSVYVDRNDVITGGSCDSVPFAGVTIVRTSLFSQPPDEEGTELYSIPADHTIYIQALTKEGEPPPGAAEEGYWILVKYPSAKGYLVGWIWSTHIEYQ
jgi:hypothetical protein